VLSENREREKGGMMRREEEMLQLLTLLHAVATDVFHQPLSICHFLTGALLTLKSLNNNNPRSYISDHLLVLGVASGSVAG